MLITVISRLNLFMFDKFVVKIRVGTVDVIFMELCVLLKINVHV